MAAGYDAGHRRNDGGVALAGAGGSAIGGSSVEIGAGLVERGGTHEFLADETLRPVVADLGIGVLRLGGACRFGRLAGVDAHQHIALFNRLTGVSLDFKNPAGDLRTHRRLLHGLNQRFGRKSQIDGMWLDGDDRQRLSGNCCGQPEKKAKNERAKNVCAHKYKHTLINEQSTSHGLLIH